MPGHKGMQDDYAITVRLYQENKRERKCLANIKLGGLNQLYAKDLFEKLSHRFERIRMWLVAKQEGG